jgi:hypothetical protein
VFVGNIYIFDSPNTKKDYMLEFCKQVLHKVSFDRSLFEKELRKAVKWLSKEDRAAFKSWCMVTFGVVYAEVINGVFDSVI